MKNVDVQIRKDLDILLLTGVHCKLMRTIVLHLFVNVKNSTKVKLLSGFFQVEILFKILKIYLLHIYCIQLLIVLFKVQAATNVMTTIMETQKSLEAHALNVTAVEMWI